jgi:hypothetical protein
MMPSGEMNIPTTPSVIAARFLPSLRDSMGATTAPSVAEKKIASVISPICSDLKPQK